MKPKKRILLILLLLLFLILLYYLFTSYFVKSQSLSTGQSDMSPSVSEKSKSTDNSEVSNATIVKCQNTVVTPEITTELYTYASGSKIRMDYRMNATTEEKSGNHQAFYDGSWLYIWDRGTNDLAPVDGIKMQLNNFITLPDTGVLGDVSAFKTGQISGDRICNTWDDVDPVLDVPKNVTFTQSGETKKTWDKRLNTVCMICNKIADNESQTKCLSNLNCVIE